MHSGTHVTHPKMQRRPGGHIHWAAQRWGNVSVSLAGFDQQSWCLVTPESTGSGREGHRGCGKNTTGSPMVPRIWVLSGLGQRCPTCFKDKIALRRQRSAEQRSLQPMAGGAELDRFLPALRSGPLRAEDLGIPSLEFRQECRCLSWFP